MEDYTATYSPEDNKLRLYSLHRLDSETYTRVKAAGFRWAPKQDLFVAPMWTPGREDLLIELCGEIGDEDSSLVDRAEERANRFENYSDKRAQDAESAHAGVEAITNHIPLGQPILVGHHSEKRARKDAERIENGMRKAVKMWETSKYWEYRAAGAIRHAKYKERPQVRARRIKKIEADKRRQEKYVKEFEIAIKLWTTENKELTRERAMQTCNFYDHMSLCFTLTEYPRPEDISQYEGPMSLWGALDHGIITPEQAKALSLPSKEKAIARCKRWINHYNNRLVYEKAMLTDQGASDLLKPKARPKQMPICNYKAPVGYVLAWNGYSRELEKKVQVEMTKEEYNSIYKEGRFVRIVEKTHRMKATTARRIPGYIDKLGLTGIDRTNAAYRTVFVFIIDSKIHKKPDPIEEHPAEKIDNTPPPVVERMRPPVEAGTNKFKAMKDSLKEGVKIAVSPQLFPTPPEIAEKMFDYADIEAGMCVLEPSAGTGNLVKVVLDKVDTEVLAYEINGDLCRILEKSFPSYKLQVRKKDFLEVTDFQGNYERILMNPPFEKGVDIKHIKHALTMLKPGGRLVALCANGPRQREAFMNLAEHWEDLPEGSFKQQGTGVNVALMVIAS